MTHLYAELHAEADAAIAAMRTPPAMLGTRMPGRS